MRASTAQKKTAHIVLLANAPWTDAKQLCIFATRIVRIRPTHVTIFTSDAFLERAKRELASELAQDAALGTYIRVIALLSDRHHQFVDPVFEADFAKTYRQILADQPVRCIVTGEVHDRLAVPDAIITPKNSTLDALTRLHEQTNDRHRAATPTLPRPKLLVWYSRVPAYLFFFHGPSERGGIGDVRAKVRAEAARKRVPDEEVFEEVSKKAERLSRVRFADEVAQTVSFLESTLLRIPGYEPMYSHEIQPQEATEPPRQPWPRMAYNIRVRPARPSPPPHTSPAR
ncbi:hypothetical protein BN946_scf184579.g20 [Trametes cinnabarina]|uniref:Uncharacterized protein n=1 Tax=Pycnoporus cinnabarinus TaxID=5643 RepID=A0A060SE58_PYCCI|nr:hypothetical protein BN946_scf184579.g20 [Trametes cinnabarina]